MITRWAVFIAAVGGADVAAFNARNMQAAKVFLANTLLDALRKTFSNGKPLLSTTGGGVVSLRPATPEEAEDFSDWLDEIAESAVQGEHVVRIIPKTDPGASH